MSRTIQRAVIGAALTAAAIFGVGYQTTDAGAAPCHPHPDACEAPEGTDHAPVLDRTITGTADITWTIFGWSF
jgi:hypothetical protein